MRFTPAVVHRDGLDSFGNVWTRLIAPPGRLEIRNEFIIQDSGMPDEVAQSAQLEVDELPDAVITFLHGSRYCDTQLLSDHAWELFGNVAGGWHRVQVICDYVNNHIKFGYQYARCDRTAYEGHTEN